MADQPFLASNSFEGDGTTTDWEFSWEGLSPDSAPGAVPYISVEDIHCEELVGTGDDQVTTQVEFTLLTPTKVRVTPATAVGTILRVYRVTENRFPLVDYNELQTVSEADLDLANRQAVYIVQEARDAARGAGNIQAEAIAIAQGAAVEAAESAAEAEASAAAAETASAAAVAAVAALEDDVARAGADRYVMQVGDTQADLVTAVATGREVIIPKAVTITVNNSAGIGITFAQDNIRIRGQGRILATGDSFDMLRFTGNDVSIHDITVEGPGTYQPSLGASGEPPALLQMRGQRPVVARVNHVNPFVAGTFCRGSQGGKLLFNKYSSAYAGGVAQPFLFHVYLRVCADTLVYGCEVKGGIQGICGGGDGSSTITVTDARGMTASTLRNTVVAGNTCVNQKDHAVYFSNDTVNTIIEGNPYLFSTNDAIKIEGGPNKVLNNTAEGSIALTGRNVFKTEIAHNHFTSNLNSVNAYGILLFDTVFKRNIVDVNIHDNDLVHTASVSTGGIYVIGDVWDGFQSVIKNLKINNNNISGYGNTSEGFGIGVFQTLFPGPPVTGSLGENIQIRGNNIKFPAHAVTSYAITLGRGLKSGVVADNVLDGFRGNGVRMLGVQDFDLFGNTLIMDPAASGVFGFFERQKDTNLHFNSQGNRYGQNLYKGSFSRQVLHSDESCFNNDRLVVRRTGALSTDSIVATLWWRHVIYTNHTAGAVITLDNLTTGPWAVDTDITISNAHATNSLTVNPGGFTVTAGTSLRLVCTGSNAFIRVT